MASKAVSRQAAKQFQVGLNRLENLWDEVRKAEENLTQRQLTFAKTLYQLEQTAKELDGDDGADYYQALHERVLELVGSQSRSLRSKWLTIGRHADDLLPFSANLPSSTEALYLITNSYKKSSKPLEKWIGSGKLTSSTSVRDTRALVTNKRTSSGQRVSQAQSHLMTTVRLDFADGSNRAIAKSLLDLLSLPGLTKVTTNKAVISSIKANLSAEEFDRLEMSGVFSVS